MNYITKSGYDLILGRIPRESVDNFVMKHPLPVPPTRAVPVFGGIEEMEPDENDPEYQQKLRKWLLDFGDAQISLILPAIEFEIDEKLEDLQEISDFTIEQCVRSFVLEDQDDFTNVINTVLYNSTVTQQAIDEAGALFNVTWYETDLLAKVLPPSPAKYGMVYESREAARFANYSWHNFCGLTGQEQSAIVAHFRLEKKLRWLMAMKT